MRQYHSFFQNQKTSDMIQVSSVQTCFDRKACPATLSVGEFLHNCPSRDAPLHLKNISKHLVEIKPRLYSTSLIERRGYIQSEYFSDDGGSLIVTDLNIESYPLPLTVLPEILLINPGECVKLSLRVDTSKIGYHDFRLQLICTGCKWVGESSEAAKSMVPMLQEDRVLFLAENDYQNRVNFEVKETNQPRLNYLPIPTDSLVIGVRACVVFPRIEIDKKSCNLKLNRTSSTNPSSISELPSPRGSYESEVLSQAICIKNPTFTSLSLSIACEGPIKCEPMSAILGPQSSACFDISVDRLSALSYRSVGSGLLGAGWEGGWRPGVSEISCRIKFELGGGYVHDLPVRVDIEKPVLSVECEKRIDFGFLKLESPFTIQHKFYISNISRVCANLAVKHLSSEEKGAEDGGFKVFNFSQVCGKLRGPSRPIRLLPRVVTRNHSDSCDFDPLLITIDFKPKAALYYHSDFAVYCDDIETFRFSCRGCGSQEEVDDESWVSRKVLRIIRHEK